MKNQARVLLCVWLATSQQRVNQPFYITSEVNRTIKHCLFIAPTSDRIYVIFTHFTYNSAVVSQNILTTPNYTHSIQSDRSTRFPWPCATTYKNENNINHFCMEDSTIRQDCSVKSIYFCVVCRVIIGFEQKLSKRSWQFNFQNHPSNQPVLTFAAKKLKVPSAV